MNSSKLGIILALSIGVTGLFWQSLTGAAESATVIAPPTIDAPATTDKSPQTAVLAGGCFWGVQGVFEHVKGVKKVVSGYAGGDKSTAFYPKVGTGSTGHAEAVQVTFDPAEISYGKLLQIYFSVAHDPTTLNRQGPDRGTQYRSAIFYADEAQKNIAQRYIDQLNKSKAFPNEIVTSVNANKGFYAAEDYHQDYLFYNPTNSYIVFNDLPKISNLKKVFPNNYRSQAMLISGKLANPQ